MVQAISMYALPVSSLLLVFLLQQLCHADDIGWQPIPSAQPKPDNTYADKSIPQLMTEPPIDDTDVNPVYGVHPTDIHMGRLHFGAVKFFGPGQLNTPDGWTDDFQQNVNDYANQSACGIPDNAFYISKVAIHPYHLKYAPEGLGLSRKSPVASLPF